MRKIGSEQDSTSRIRGGFFAVDAAVWGQVCERVDTNAAAAFLVLARGSGRDHSTTGWSVQAVQTYLGLSLGRAQSAVQKLLSAGVLERLKAGTRPSYALAKPATDPRWIWLPNSLVDGAASETPPIELMRQGQDVALLRWFVELYAEQHLAEHGGISPEIVRGLYTREQVGARGSWVVWGFRPHDVVSPRAGFIDRLVAVFSLGLVELMPHVVESDATDAQLVHPYGMHWKGDGSESSENRLGILAHRAAEALLTAKQRSRADGRRLCLLPALAHRSAVSIIGILRLKYRANTRVTAAWLAARESAIARHAADYNELLATEAARIA